MKIVYIIFILLFPVMLILTRKLHKNNSIMLTFYIFMVIAYFILASVGLYFNTGGICIYINYAVSLYFLIRFIYVLSRRQVK